MDQETKTGYEPDRIPPSVFTSTITPKQDWSVQSNESLFSIHMGDQSFSKMYKSGELTNFEYTASYINNNNNNTNMDNKITSTDAPPRDTIPKTPPKQDEPQRTPLSPAKSYRSDTSNNSAASFAFPTLPEYQQNQKKSLNMMKSESDKTEKSTPDSKTGLFPDDSKPGNGGGWLSCFFCFSVKY